jgi:hypothetical protein
MWATRSIRLLWIVNCVLACSSGNDSKSNAVDWAAGRGTPACHEWQQAYCNFQAKCLGGDLATCAQQVQTITCISDTTAANCATSIESATCSAVSVACNATDIADAAYAQQQCTDYLTALCTHDANCAGGGEVDSCVASLQTTISCNNAIGVKLNYESCLAQINAASCAGTFPSGCSSLIYTTAS